MKNRWNEKKAKQIDLNDRVGLRVYSSRLLGEEAELVMHGGGNTSVKGELVNAFGETEQVLFVKGSGWDLKTIEAAGFPPVKMDYLLRLGDLEQLSDSEMMRQLRLALLDPTAPTPSVEAILHALIPHTYVDHSHADAVVTISNTPDGESMLREIYGEDVLILPYIMPGFILARQVAAATKNIEWANIRGIILMHHGIFTFHEQAKTSYDTMIELVSKAEAYLQVKTGNAALAASNYEPDARDCLQLSQLRASAGEVFGASVLLRLDSSRQASGFASLTNCDELLSRGPLTPDHTIHTKAFAAVFDGEPVSGLQEFVTVYQKYFELHAAKTHQCLDCMPRYGVWRNKGMVYLAGNRKRLEIVQDITLHTLKAILLGEALGGWQALSRRDLFDVEYWELEQAKIQAGASRAEYEGKVVAITGAASGIGRACVDEFIANGAVVLALDIASGFETQFKNSAVLAMHCDVTNTSEIDMALQQGIIRFGGIDVLVSNAGNFPESQTLESMADSNWEQSIELNLTSHMKVMRACLPYLRNGFDPSIVIVASKNVPAPGPGAAAYSAAKAGLTQMARVAALELGGSGIRVNTVHPNAVYDTALWTDDILEKRASSYGMTVDEYKTSNVLKTEVTSVDVAKSVSVLAGTTLAKTTGVQLPIDGGNDRVI